MNYPHKNTHFIAVMVVINAILGVLAVSAIGVLIRKNPDLCFQYRCSYSSSELKGEDFSITAPSISSIPEDTVKSSEIEESKTLNKVSIGEPEISVNSIPVSSTIINSVPKNVLYSSYVVNPIVSISTTKSHETQVDFSLTQRNIFIKKMVIQTHNIPSNCVLTGSGFFSSQVTEISNNLWEINGKFNLNSGSIIFDDCMHDSPTPLFDQWIIWDNTSNLPVKINN